MTPEQKQQARQAVEGWQSVRNDDPMKPAGDVLATLLQELIDAPEPEPEPVAYVTGVYGGHTTVVPVDAALVLRVGMALYAAPPAPADVARDAERLDWLDVQCSENNGRHIFCLPGGLRAAIDAAMSEKGQS